MRFLLSTLAFLFICQSAIFAQSWSRVGTAGELAKKGGGATNLCFDRMGNLYATGEIEDSTNNVIVKKWNGSSWAQLGSLNCAEVYSMCADTSNNIYISLSDRIGRQHVEKWNGSSWNELGADTDIFNAPVISICLDKHNNLYAAGDFGDSTIRRVKKWDGTSWSQVGDFGGNGALETIMADTADNLYITGDFTDSATSYGGNVYVAKWNGTSWSELGTGITHQVAHSLQMFAMLQDTSGNIYVGGNLWDSSGNSYIAKWDGTSWSRIGGMLDSGAVFTMC